MFSGIFLFCFSADGIEKKSLKIRQIVKNLLFSEKFVCIDSLCKKDYSIT